MIRMDECNSCENNKQASVPFFIHENDMMHYNRANKRMLIALCVSVTSIMIAAITLGYMFLKSYNEREKGWQEIVQQRIMEVRDGVHQQSDP